MKADWQWQQELEEHEQWLEANKAKFNEIFEVKNETDSTSTMQSPKRVCTSTQDINEPPF
jgi:hypothetical protein